MDNKLVKKVLAELIDLLEKEEIRVSHFSVWRDSTGYPTEQGSEIINLNSFELTMSYSFNKKGDKNG